MPSPTRTPSPLAPPKRVLLLISPDQAYGRDVLEGIIQHNQLHDRWQLRLGPTSPSQLPKALRDADAVIAEAIHRKTLEALPAPHPPIVIVTGELRPARLPMVVADNHASGQLAANYLHQLGLRHLAFVGHPTIWFSRVRQLAFQRRAKILHLSCHTFLRTSLTPAPLKKWLLSLPRPVGLFCMNLTAAKSVSDACIESRLRVPEDIAILGVDRDDVTSHLSVPPLSTIDLGVDRIGQRAAQLLSQLLQGHAPPRSPIVVPPLGVIEAQSTDVLAVDNADLARAIRYIRAHATSSLRITDLLAAIPVSRRKLEIDFRRLLGRTIEQEIRRVRLDTARQLLTRTALPISAVAARSGFKSSAHLANTFRRDLALTPNQCRHGKTPSR